MAEDHTNPGEIDLDRGRRGDPSERPHVGLGRSGASESPESVVVRDMRMSFGSMVIFMVKWAITSIPALIILIVFGLVTSALAAGLIASLVSFRSLSSQPNSGKVAFSSSASAVTDLLIERIRAGYASDVTDADKSELDAAYADFRRALEEKRVRKEDMEKVRDAVKLGRVGREEVHVVDPGLPGDRWPARRANRDFQVPERDRMEHLQRPYRL